MRILVLSCYSHPSHHRKIELLADLPDVEILQVLQPNNGTVEGIYPSANGQYSYQVKVVFTRSSGETE